MAVAGELEGTGNRAIAVIGDGSLTGGMAFEALNQAGHLKKNLVVILNDNEMSISKNVGAFSSFISRKMTGSYYRDLKKEMQGLLEEHPGHRHGYPPLRQTGGKLAERVPHPRSAVRGTGVRLPRAAGRSRPAATG